MWWLNETNNTEQPEIDEDEDITLDSKSAELIIFFIFTILTIFGNTLVLVATWKERRLHQPNKYFVACLAVADLLVGMILDPLRLYQTGIPDAPSIHLCRFAVWIDTSALTASIYTLTFISFDRYLKVKKPLQYRSRMTTSKSLKIIFIIWLISIAFASYAAAPHSGSYGILLTGNEFCDDIKSSKNEKSFFTFAAITLFFLPAVVILVMYALIFVVVHKRQKMLRNGELGQTCNDTNQRSAFLQDLKTVRMLLVVVGVFILCWGPVFIVIVFFFYKHTLVDWVKTTRHGLIVRKVLLSLPYFNSLCNPIIYACLDQTYRKAFKNIFQRMLCRSRPRRRQPPEAIELPPVRTR